MRFLRVRKCAALVVAAFGVWMLPHQASAHCDSLEGPVVRDARVALEKGDPAPALKWVSREGEAEIRAAFKRTMAVRGKGEDVRAVADLFFFETLVRVHRAGEGEPFTGLKPFGSTDRFIVAADTALQAGSADELASQVSVAVSEGLQKRFALALERKKHAAGSVEAGRRYVEAYVDFVHFVEGVSRPPSHGALHAHQEPAPQAGR